MYLYTRHVKVKGNIWKVNLHIFPFDQSERQRKELRGEIRKIFKQTCVGLREEVTLLELEMNSKTSSQTDNAKKGALTKLYRHALVHPFVILFSFSLSHTHTHLFAPWMPWAGVTWRNMSSII